MYSNMPGSYPRQWPPTMQRSPDDRRPPLHKPPTAAPATPGKDLSSLLLVDTLTMDALTVVAPHLICEFERVHYWHGISMDPPELLYRSDLKSNPFPIPAWDKMV